MSVTVACEEGNGRTEMETEMEIRYEEERYGREYYLNFVQRRAANTILVKPPQTGIAIVCFSKKELVTEREATVATTVIVTTSTRCCTRRVTLSQYISPCRQLPPLPGWYY